MDCKSPGHAVYKLCDFGLGIIRSPESTAQISYGGGTPGWIAPVCMLCCTLGVVLIMSIGSNGKQPGLERKGGYICPWM